ncbi:MAG: ABC transporter substrate-binding protein [Oscillospiraceae bacterium]|nr:ABC transporter substrate-binding protein [Oscillospiraceae bacterium]
MKKYLAIILACMMLICVFAGCGQKAATESPASGAEASASGDKVVKIGVFEPASGDNGAGGKQESLGVQYANTVQPTVEIAGETYKVELVPVDNQSSTDKAVSAAQELVSAGVSVVLGSYGSSVCMAASDTFKNAGVPAIGITCTNPNVTAGNTHYFRICFLDPFQGTVLANFAKDQFQSQKAYCLAKLGDDYSVGLCNYFKEAFEKLGGEVVYETFPDGNSDFSSYVTNAKNSGADVFFAPVSTDAAALIIDQANAQGLTMPILAGDTWDSNVILNAAKGKNVKVYVDTFYQEGGNKEFDDGFRAWLESDSTALANNGGDTTIAAVSAMGYDAYFVALEALKAAGTTDPKAVNDAIWSLKYTGVSGDIAFDSTNGDAVRNTAYVKSANTETGVWDFVGVQTAK